MEDHAEYVGPVENLKGKRALVRPTDKEQIIEAQFDKCPRHSRIEDCSGDCLTIGWHEFSTFDFKLLVRVTWC